MKQFIDYIVGATVGLVIFALIGTGIYTYDYIATQAKNNEPIGNWFEVTQLYIPDFKVGEDVSIIYDRDIKQAYSAKWEVEIQKIEKEGLFAACSNDGISNPDPTKVLPPEGVTLSWFMQKECKLAAGEYRVSVTWHIQRDGYKEVDVEAVSNIFTVT